MKNNGLSIFKNLMQKVHTANSAIRVIKYETGCTRITGSNTKKIDKARLAVPVGRGMRNIAWSLEKRWDWTDRDSVVAVGGRVY